MKYNTQMGFLERFRRSPDRVDRIHFLIHPGYSTDPDALGENTPLCSPDMYSILFGNYLNHARSLSKNEVIFAFLHSDLPHYRTDVRAGKPYTLFLKELRQILSRRLVTMADGFQLFTLDENPQRARAIAQRRGYTFGNRVESVAWGETMIACVTMGAEALNKYYKLKAKTNILPSLTEGAVYVSMQNEPEEVKAQQLQEAIAYVMRNKRRITFI